MYRNCFKRLVDFLLSLIALIVLSPVLLILIVLGAIKMKGNPFFTQIRPGRDEILFRMIKFRSMTNKKDAEGRLLPDAQRLTGYGRFIRETSLDELPELLNILAGHMSIVGPRPQLVRDMVFMTPEQRRRHTVRQGLTGLAQCNGRNGISWEKKLEYDLKYIESITFWGDVAILLKTVLSVVRREGVHEEEMATSEDYGDYLLRIGAVDLHTYKAKLAEAEEKLGAGV